MPSLEREGMIFLHNLAKMLRKEMWICIEHKLAVGSGGGSL